MAKFNFYVPDEATYTTFVASGGITREDTLTVCMAGAKVLLERLREWLAANTHDAADWAGALAASLVAEPVYSSVFVQPKGKHHGKSTRDKMNRASGYRRAKTGQGRGRAKKEHHGMTAGVSASDVGYYLEYGTPRMDARHWMEQTVEAADDEIQAAMEAAWDELLKSKGL